MTKIIIYFWGIQCLIKIKRIWRKTIYDINVKVGEKLCTTLYKSGTKHVEASEDKACPFQFQISKHNHNVNVKLTHYKYCFDIAE